MTVFSPVIPAHAGIPLLSIRANSGTPACAGVTEG